MQDFIVSVLTIFFLTLLSCVFLLMGLFFKINWSNIYFNLGLLQLHIVNSTRLKGWKLTGWSEFISFYLLVFVSVTGQILPCNVVTKHIKLVKAGFELSLQTSFSMCSSAHFMAYLYINNIPVDQCQFSRAFSVFHFLDNSLILCYSLCFCLICPFGDSSSRLLNLQAS